jgi:hypothetical protein
MSPSCTQTTDITSTDIQINSKTPIVKGSQSDSSMTPYVLLDDRSDITSSTTTTTTNSTTSKISFKRPRGRPRKFSNKYASIVDQVVSTKSGRRTSQKIASGFRTSRITGKSTSSSEIYYSDTSDSFSVRSGSAATSYSSEDDSHLEKIMVIFYNILQYIFPPNL